MAGLRTFAPGGQPDEFVTVTGTNQIRRFKTNEDSSNAASFTEEGHLKLRYTAIACERPSKKRKLNDAGHLLALGTDDGRISIFDVHKGKRIQRVEPDAQGTTQRVTAVGFSPKGRLCYAVTADGFCSKYSVKTGQLKGKFETSFDTVHHPTAVAASPCGKFLAVASSSIRLFDSSTHHLLREFVGHATPVSALKWTSDSAYFVTAAQGNAVCCWKTQGKKQTKVQPIRQLHVDSSPVSLATCVVDSKLMGVAAVLEGGAKAQVWHFSTKLKRKHRSVPVPPSATISVDTSDPVVAPLEGPLLDAQFFGSPYSLIAARGPVIRPSFCKLALRAEEKAGEPLLTEISLPKLKLNQPKAKQLRIPRPAQNEDVIGVGDLPAPVNTTNHAAPARKRPRPNESDEEEVNPKRMKIGELNLETSDPQPSEPTTPIPSLGGAKSLHSVLKQALVSTDSRMLEVCLQSNKQETITNTVRRLCSTEATQLLDKLVEIFRKHHRRAGDLFPWIRTLLYTHGSTLHGSPSHLRLKQAIDYRVQWLVPLLKLSGRLDYAFHQQFSPVDQEPPPEPLNVYDDPQDPEDPADKDGD